MRTKHSARGLILAVAAGAIDMAALGASHLVVAPNNLEFLEGNDSSSAFYASAWRYQQVYAASEFSSVSNGGQWITTIAFRVDTPNGRGFGATLTNLQVNLSTTPRDPDQLSPLFGDNVGSDDALVFGPAPLEFSVPFITTGSPQVFAIIVPLDNWFFYDPAAGNLLMDVRLFRGNDLSLPPWDAANRTGDSVSRLYGPIGGTSGTRDSVGLVTEFLVTDIPEPAPLALLVAGLTGWALMVWRKRR